MQQAVHREQDEDVELKWDLEAISWLQDNVQGTPVVLEAHHHQYHWTSRIANYTGMPTVLGWPWHQIQQRTAYRHAIGDRARDVEEIYTTGDEERAYSLLKKYEVEYVIVGQLEQAYYPESGLEKFERMVGKGLAFPVFHNQGINIYRILW